MRILPNLFVAAACALTLANCSHRSKEMKISPPLPPAEEPSDDVQGAYAGDAGATP